MLNELEIKNYRNLKELKINSLGRVNLITGKNNTGKSTLLEAIAIYATNGELTLIRQLLEERGEPVRETIMPINETSKNPVQENIKIFSSLFNNRIVGFDVAEAISIGNKENSISLKFVKYIDEVNKDDQGNIIRNRIYLKDNSEATENYKIGFEIKTMDSSNILPLDKDRFRLFRRYYVGSFNSNNVQFVKTRNTDKTVNSSLFDNIALTDKEQNVINALKIIEPLTERITFIEEIPRRDRNAVIKLSGSQNILPLQSMGDGINRILTIILALVNAESGYLLIDEFENGLHYSVQENLWKIIFQLSKELNIQVFATTHSKDCIRSFQSVLNNQENLTDGKLIRLDNKKGIIKQVEFDAKELETATDHDIEIR